MLDAVRQLRRGLSRRGKRGRKRKRGRPPEARAKRRGLTNKERSAFVFKHRWLIVKRRDRMSEQERADLATMLSYLPELKTLRAVRGPSGDALRGGAERGVGLGAAGGVAGGAGPSWRCPS